MYFLSVVCLLANRSSFFFFIFHFPIYHRSFAFAITALEWGRLQQAGWKGVLLVKTSFDRLHISTLCGSLTCRYLLLPSSSAHFSLLSLRFCLRQQASINSYVCCLLVHTRFLLHLLSFLPIHTDLTILTASLKTLPFILLNTPPFHHPHSTQTAPQISKSARLRTLFETNIVNPFSRLIQHGFQGLRRGLCVSCPTHNLW